MTLQKPARTTDPVDELIRKSFRRRDAMGGYETDDEIKREIAKATGLTTPRVSAALDDHPA
jgi:hypothetical protein